MKLGSDTVIAMRCVAFGAAATTSIPGGEGGPAHEPKPSGNAATEITAVAPRLWIELRPVGSVEGRRVVIWGKRSNGRRHVESEPRRCKASFRHAWTRMSGSARITTVLRSYVGNDGSTAWIRSTTGSRSVGADGVAVIVLARALGEPPPKIATSTPNAIAPAVRRPEDNKIIDF
jgi:hypothetical protein